MVVERQPRNAGAHARVKVGRSHFRRLVELRQIDANAAAQGDDAAFQPGSGPVGNDRHVVGVTDLANVRHLTRRARGDDEVGAAVFACCATPREKMGDLIYV